jgi:hypothetical protein
MKCLFHTLPKTLGEDFLHFVAPTSIMVAGSKLIARFAPSTRSSITEHQELPTGELWRRSADKIDVSALRVRADQFHLKLVAHVHPLLPTDEKALRGRV